MIARSTPAAPRPLYTAEQRLKRDQSCWTLVQGILAPLQFLAFLVSLILVVRFLATGIGHDSAALSVLVKTLFLLTIMITGSLWEHDVYGRYLFAPAFFWEDVISMGVIALHLMYVACWWLELGSAQWQMGIALLAYLVYVVNAAQFMLKLRQARLGMAGAARPVGAAA